MNIYIWEYDPFQYVTTTATSGGTNAVYYWGECFTPNKNCSITKVKFLLWDNPFVGTLKIGVGSNASGMSSTQTYNITATDNPDGIYTLSTPYSLTANTKYCIVFKISSGCSFGMKNSMSGVYPVVCDDITYNYGTYSSTDQEYNYALSISGLEITTS